LVKKHVKTEEKKGKEKASENTFKICSQLWWTMVKNARKFQRQGLQHLFPYLSIYPFGYYIILFSMTATSCWTS